MHWVNCCTKRQPKTTGLGGGALGHAPTEQTRCTSSELISHDQDGASVHTLEQGDGCFREAFGLKYIEDRSVVHRIECILDVEIQDDQEALFTPALLYKHAV